jgi:hypothetical protein
MTATIGIASPLRWCCDGLDEDRVEGVTVDVDAGGDGVRAVVVPAARGDWDAAEEFARAANHRPAATS